MRLLFCSDPLSPRVPDAAYAEEVAAAERLGIAYSLVSFEALTDKRNADKAVRCAAPAEQDAELGLYRGWMLRTEQYAALYEALADRRVRLLNTPAQYERCHRLPSWYNMLKGSTPRSVWTEAGDMSLPRIMALLKEFGDRPVIVKDYVKSRKHEWREACFIPSASDTDAVARVTERFLKLQGSDLNGGLVLREFVPFEPLGSHTKSGMPLTREFRLFVLDGEIVQMSPYWEEGNYAGETPPREHFTRLAAGVDSRFFTMDVAKTTTGEWLVVELGDAQVAELPADVDTSSFLGHLSETLEIRN